MTEFSMDEVVEILRTTFGVETAHVQQTGGGIATIYAGAPYLDTEGDERYPAVAGPGTYGWGKRPSEASTGEFYIGSDNDGASEAYSTPEDATVEQIATYIYAQTFVDDTMRLIREAIGEGTHGTIPVTVPDYSSLHDYRDANTFMDDVGAPMPGDTEWGIEVVAAIQELCDIRIRAGELLPEWIREKFWQAKRWEAIARAGGNS